MCNFAVWSRPVLDVRRLQVLQELDRHGTVAAAAAALHLTPSAVSQQLAALAREAGCPVVERDGRNVRLTPAARVLLDHAGRLFAQLELLESDLQRHQLGEVGTVRIGAFQTAACRLVVPAAVVLAVSHPGLEVELVQMDAPTSFLEVAAGRLDLAISVEYTGSPPAGDPRFTRIPLLHDQMRVLLPADHPRAGQEEVALSELRHDPWIGNLPGSPCHFVTTAACAAAGFSPLLRHHIDDWAIIVELAAAGLGVGLIPGLAQPEPREDIAMRRVAGAPVARNIFAAVRQGTETAPTIATVLEALHHVASRYADDLLLT
jgi:DNA-binding transcriptional LysR family regulator